MIKLPESRRQSYIRGAAILGATMVFVKIISAVYRLPIMNILGDEGAGHFAITYQIYAVLLAVSTTGIPVALARLISTASTTGRPMQVNRYFSSALAAFTILGIIFSFIMFFFADYLAAFMNDDKAAYGIRILSPAVLFVCMVSVYEGYGQGHNDMIPTSSKQITEVLFKVMFGLAASWWLASNGYDSPVVAAGAIVGTPIGLCVALFILIAHKRKTDRTLSVKTVTYYEDRPDSRLKTLGSIFRVSIPVTLGASFMSILTLVDTIVVRNRLASGAGFSPEAVDVLFGVYSKGQTLLVLPSALIVPVTITIVPVIAAMLANNRQKAAKGVMETSLKLTNVLAMPAGLGLCVLAYPIFTTLFPGSNQNGPACLAIFGIASYFICLQLMTTSILHANGYERSPALTYLVGGIAQIAVDYILVANPDIGIVGSPVGTLTCYFLISALNLIFIIRKVKSRPGLTRIMLGPALCSAVMAVAAKSIYELIFRAGSGVLGTGQLALYVYLAVTVFAAFVLYTILVIATKTVTRADVEMLPKGKKIADFLRMR